MQGLWGETTMGGATTNFVLVGFGAPPVVGELLSLGQTLHWNLYLTVGSLTGSLPLWLVGRDDQGTTLMKLVLLLLLVSHHVVAASKSSEEDSSPAESGVLPNLVLYNMSFTKLPQPEIFFPSCLQENLCNIQSCCVPEVSAPSLVHPLFIVYPSLSAQTWSTVEIYVALF